MRLLLLIAIVATIVYLAYVNIFSPPKPSVVVVTGGNKPQNVTQPPQPQIMPTTSGFCDKVYMRVGQVEACGVTYYTDSYIVVSAPGWVKGTFTIASISDRCVFNTAQGYLSISGNCAVYIVPVR